MEAGEQTGTFRGNNLALVSATAAINIYWRCGTFTQEVQRMGAVVRRRLRALHLNMEVVLLLEGGAWHET